MKDEKHHLDQIVLETLTVLAVVLGLASLPRITKLPEPNRISEPVKPKESPDEPKVPVNNRSGRGRNARNPKSDGIASAPAKQQTSQFANRDRYTPISARAQVQEFAMAIAERHVEATLEQKIEFCDLIVKELDQMREHGEDVIKAVFKDLEKDVFKEIGEHVIVVPTALTIVKCLRSKPQNPIAKATADVIEKHLKKT